MLLLSLASKKCASCHEVKPTTEFPAKKNKGKWGFYSYCTCCKRKKAKQYYLDNTKRCKELARNRDLKKYGLTINQQKAMLEKQEGRCAICGKSIYLFGNSKNNTAHVDHDHSSGEVRGLLCQECNTGLGKFRDNTLFLSKAIEYLEASDKRKQSYTEI